MARLSGAKRRRVRPLNLVVRWLVEERPKPATATGELLVLAGVAIGILGLGVVVSYTSEWRFTLLDRAPPWVQSLLLLAGGVVLIVKVLSWFGPEPKGDPAANLEERIRDNE